MELREQRRRHSRPSGPTSLSPPQRVEVRVDELRLEIGSGDPDAAIEAVHRALADWVLGDAFATGVGRSAISPIDSLDLGAIELAERLANRPSGHIGPGTESDAR